MRLPSKIHFVICLVLMDFRYKVSILRIALYMRLFHGIVRAKIISHAAPSTGAEGIRLEAHHHGDCSKEIYNFWFEVGAIQICFSSLLP